VLGVLTNHHNLAFSLDDLALIADLLDGWFNLHCYYTIPFCFGVCSHVRVTSVVYLKALLRDHGHFALQVMRPLSRS